jgi:hypothetical protein
LHGWRLRQNQSGFHSNRSAPVRVPRLTTARWRNAGGAPVSDQDFADEPVTPQVRETELQCIARVKKNRTLRRRRSETSKRLPTNISRQCSSATRQWAPTMRFRAQGMTTCSIIRWLRAMHGASNRMRGSQNSMPSLHQLKSAVETGRRSESSTRKSQAQSRHGYVAASYGTRVLRRPGIRTCHSYLISSRSRPPSFGSRRLFASVRSPRISTRKSRI